MKTALDNAVEEIMGITSEELLAMTHFERIRYIEKTTGKKLQYVLHEAIPPRGCVMEESMYWSKEQVNEAFDLAISG